MFNDPFHWFPNAVLSNVYAVLVIGLPLLDAWLQQAGARRRIGAPRQRSDAGSVYVVNGAIVLSLLIAVGFRYFGLGVAPAWAQYAAIAVMALAFVLREWSVLTLGAFFSNVVEIEEGHQLITGGPYRWLRHPGYTGLLVFFVAAALGLGTWIGSLVALVLLLAAVMYRIGIEERLLAQTFGARYGAYMQRTWRLLPGW